MAKIVVEMTRDLTNQLGDDAPNYNAAFMQWREAGGGDFHHPWFGWNNPYERPEPTDRNADWTLYHVHIAPFEPQISDFEDEEAFQKAQKTYKDWMYSKRTWRGRPTSDDVLVYAYDSSPTRPRFLLIDILQSPNAHKIARMTNQPDREKMLAYLTVAEEYVYSRKIII